MKNIMIDIEGLSTSADTLIVSIGAVEFDKSGIGTSLYLPCFKEQRERKMDLGTISWWMEQPEKAREVFFDWDKAISLKSALAHLRDFISWQDDYIWVNGALYDGRILEHAYSECRIRVPWKYSNFNCLRAVRRLHPEYDQIIDHLRGEKASHNALDDATCQAQALIDLSVLKNLNL